LTVSARSRHLSSVADFLEPPGASLSKRLSRRRFARTCAAVLGLVLPSVSLAQATADSVGPGAATHGVGVEYGYVRFEGDLDRWQLASVSVREATPMGPAIARVSYADRFAERGVQLEVDAYPRLSRSLYAYLNAGYAPSGLFPTWRFGGELYANLPGAWEASAGLRELRFDDESVTLYTGSVGKYSGNYWLSLRPFARVKDGSVTGSATLTGRRYFSGADHYVGASAGYGKTPSEDPTPEELERLASFSATLHGSQPLRSELFGLWSLGFQREELASSRMRDRVELSVGLKLSW
jgi:YaiO family outer membrane protein